ncbi:mechanosensitive ion channel [Neobacillus sp. OS1-2]|uniref:mechanosensitive ion channel n=1 Tax=Neobacillus sp. OS1-2 TaxID=3070680 RepID=UPI0027E170DB|nr:mechanosensitive ion channel [Neobacillus sp. OS1-2]WML41627.1 mechanosensitive ion channel [Neobacillus sp. OS1-2]
MTLPNMMAGWYIYTDRIPHVLLALLILIIGWLVAKAIGKAVEKALTKTNLDNKLFANVGKRKYASEVIIGKMVYYLLVVVVLIFFFNMLHLSMMAEPLVKMVSTLTAAIPNLLKAALILLLAWVVAYFARMLVKKGAAMLHVESWLAKWNISNSKGNTASTINGIAQAIFYLVLLLFLPAVLGALQLEGISEPFTHTLSTMLGLIPKLFAAALIVFIGWLIAKIVRDILTHFLNSIGMDRLGERVGLAKADLSTIIGNIVFILILIPTIITALEKLDLKGISEPAIAMLYQIMTLIPNIAAAILLILAGIWLGKWIEKMVAQMLWRLRFDNILHHMGIGSLTPEQSKYTLSQLVGLLAKIVVILLFTSEAMKIVHLDFLVTLATGVLAYLPMVLAALVILGIGLYLGQLVERVLQNVLKQRYSRTLARIAKYTIFTISLFMALDQLGVAHSIVNAAFILVLGGLALAFGLAFGLGGKEFAAKYLGKLDEKIERENG